MKYRIKWREENPYGRTGQEIIQGNSFFNALLNHGFTDRDDTGYLAVLKYITYDSDINQLLISTLEEYMMAVDTLHINSELKPNNLKYAQEYRQVADRTLSILKKVKEG